MEPGSNHGALDLQHVLYSQSFALMGTFLKTQISLKEPKSKQNNIHKFIELVHTHLKKSVK